MMESRRIDELQSVRGLAAALVAISHASTVYAIPAVWRVAVDGVLNAHAAVVVFFVLSGYVLTGAIRRRAGITGSLKTFLVSRAFRLLPAAWVVSLLAYILLILIEPSSGYRSNLSQWCLGYLHGAPSLWELILALAMISAALIMPIGTVFVELVGSALMPLIVYLASRHSLVRLVSGLVLAALTILLQHAPHRLDSIGYLLCFYLGSCVALSSLPNALLNNWWLGTGIFFLVLFRTFWERAFFGDFVPLTQDYQAPVPLIVEALAASLLIAIIVSQRLDLTLLRIPCVVRFGDTSYSFYLVHFPIALAISKCLSWVMPTNAPLYLYAVTLIVLTCAISAALSELLFRAVELPLIAVGQRVVKRMRS